MLCSPTNVLITHTEYEVQRSGRQDTSSDSAGIEIIQHDNCRQSGRCDTCIKFVSTHFYFIFYFIFLIISVDLVETISKYVFFFVHNKLSCLTVNVQPSFDAARVHELVDRPSPPAGQRLGGTEGFVVVVHLGAFQHVIRARNKTKR